MNGPTCVTWITLVPLLVAVVGGSADAPQTVTRRITVADRERDRYVYVPFNVRAGTTELHVRYQYDRANGQNTIDLGIFEPGSLEIGTRAMRGYSGGSKSHIVIGECGSTPGYKTGQLAAGRWHVMLGVYSVAGDGVDVKISVSTKSEPAACTRPAVEVSRSSKSHPPSQRWFSGALHAHTVHSDGTPSALDLLRRVREARLEFVTITDHNNTTHIDEVLYARDRPATPLWIAGEEVTTPAGHANVWGLDSGEWVDFRVRPQERRINELANTARRHGALFSINHPSSECVGCSWEHEIPEALDAIEVWNGRHGAQDKAVALWERLLLAGRRVTAVGASDWHRDPDPIDNANVRVFAPDLSERAILDAIRSGRVIVMRSTGDATPAFTIRSGERSATVGESLTRSASPVRMEVRAPGVNDGRVVFVVNGTRLPSVPVNEDAPAQVERVLEPGFVRAEIYDRDGSLVALTNPVFIER